jgi:hypothetical protein
MAAKSAEAQVRFARQTHNISSAWIAIDEPSTVLTNRPDLPLLQSADASERPLAPNRLISTQ